MINNEMKIYSCGDSRSNNMKINILLYSIVFALSCSSIILGFRENFLIGLLLITTIGWLPFLMVGAIKYSLNRMKKNTIISLYFYDVDSFSKCDGIPNDKFILFGNNYGIVLADRRNEKESRSFIHNFESFYDILQYCEKHKIK